MLVASEEAALPGFNYGYLVSPEWLTAALMVLPEKHEDVVVKLEYEYFDNGYDLRFDYISEKKNTKPYWSSTLRNGRERDLMQSA